MNDPRKTGHPDQAAFVRPIRYTDGRADGLEAFQFYNGLLDFTVLKSRCMDIGDMRFRGVNAAFLSRSGLMAPQAFDIDCAADQQSGLIGGFLFTCGLSNAGARCEDGGILYPFHGQIRSCPASGCSFGCRPDEDGGTLLYAEGLMSEAVLQGVHLTLRRRVETRRMQPGFSLSDTVVNEGWRGEPLLLMYHMNFGWPLLDEDTRILIPCALPRDERMGPPEDGAEETVTPIDAQADEDGTVTLRVENARIGMGVSVRYRKAELPALGEWRSNASGDYVLGLEPGICGVEGRAELKKQGKLRILRPGERLKTRIDVSFYNM